MNSRNEPLSHQVYNAIFHHPHLNHRRMHVRADSGKVTIEGEVESYFEKQMAQEALRKVAGVQTINNRLEVSWN